MAEAFKKLKCWNNSIELGVKIYKISENFPRGEHYNIKSQIRRAVVSISNNIAEGAGVGTPKRQLFHLNVAVGSCNEVENLLYLAKRLGYIDDEAVKDIEEDVAESRRPIFGFMKYIREKHGIED